MIKNFTKFISVFLLGLFLSQNVFAQWNRIGNSDYPSSYSKTFIRGSKKVTVFQGDDGKLYVKQLNATSGAWEQLGGALTVSNAPYSAVTIDANGVIYAAYVETTDKWYAKVKCFDSANSQWVAVGGNVSADHANFVSIATNSANVPYIAYGDQNNSDTQATVKYYNGSAWVALGSEKFSQFKVEALQIYFVSDVPVVTVGGQRPELYIYNSATSTWEKNFGNDYNFIFSIAKVPFASAFDASTNTYYIATTDYDNGCYAIVKKYTVGVSSVWETISSQVLSPGAYAYISIAAKNGNVYIAFQDNSPEGGSKASLMKYDGSTWSFIGSRGLGLTGDGLAYGVEVVLDDAGNPYVGFTSGYTQGGALFTYSTGVNTDIKKTELDNSEIFAVGKNIFINSTAINNITVNDIRGAVVYSGIEPSINLSKYVGGLYIVTLNSKSGVISKKLMLK